MNNIVPLKDLFSLINLLLFAVSLTVFTQTVKAQTGPEPNIIQTAVPFLMIAPDSRAGGMGELGASSEPDINSQYWNAAKYPFMAHRFGFALSYTPWLSELLSDVYLINLVGFYRIDDYQVISASLRRISANQIIFTNNFGTPQGIILPGEFAVDAGYSRKLSAFFSGGMVLRFIYADLTGGQSPGGGNTKAAMALAGDLGFFYRKPVLRLDNLIGTLALGLQVSNVGNKISYTADQEESFLPMNLRLGGAFTLRKGERHSLSLMSDINKLLVPTPPVWLTTSTGAPALTPQGNPIIQYGKNPYVSVPQGILQSFWDAPGVLQEDGSRSRFREELYEIAIGVGLEYWYNGVMAIRWGYFHENERKGARRFLTAGAGINYKFISLDGSYLIPTKSRHPLADTYRLTLSLAFGSTLEN
jgi:hypothetical protein